MSTAFDTVNEQAQQLSMQERAELARRMLATLEPEEGDVETAWAEEIKKRVLEIRAGAVKCYSEDQVMAEIEDDLA